MKRKFWFQKQQDELQNSFSIKLILKIFNIKVKKSYRFISIPIWLYSAYKGVKNKQFFFWKLPKNTHKITQLCSTSTSSLINHYQQHCTCTYLYICIYECNWLNMNLYMYICMCLCFSEYVYPCQTKSVRILQLKLLNLL